MVLSHCYWKLDGIVILLQETAWYRHAFTENCMVSSYYYRKLHGIVMLLQETSRYRHDAVLIV
jgi:hypothetical protein